MAGISQKNAGNKSKSSLESLARESFMPTDPAVGTMAPSPTPASKASAGKKKSQTGMNVAKSDTRAPPNMEPGAGNVHSHRAPTATEAKRPAIRVAETPEPYHDPHKAPRPTRASQPAILPMNVSSPCCSIVLNSNWRTTRSCADPQAGAPMTDVINLIRAFTILMTTVTVLGQLQLG